MVFYTIVKDKETCYDKDVMTSELPTLMHWLWNSPVFVLFHTLTPHFRSLSPNVLNDHDVPFWAVDDIVTYSRYTAIAWLSSVLPHGCHYVYAAATALLECAGTLKPPVNSSTLTLGFCAKLGSSAVTYVFLFLLSLKGIEVACNMSQNPRKTVEFSGRFRWKRGSYQQRKRQDSAVIHSSYGLNAHSDAQRLLKKF